jgi:hypothetical protein
VLLLDGMVTREDVDEEKTRNESKQWIKTAYFLAA